MTNQIKQLRKDIRMSQRQLADALGVSYRTVQRWETGTREPSKKYVDWMVDMRNAVGVIVKEKDL